MASSKIIVTGDPIKGLTFYGTWPSDKAAASWAQDHRHVHGEKFDWWVADLIPVRITPEGESSR